MKKEITNDYIQDMLSKAKDYALVLLKPGANANNNDIQETLWEHVRRNFTLREEGSLPIVGPITVESNISGVGIFDTSVEEAADIMNADPAVQAGIFTYEIHPFRSFPGDKLP
jgi:uncharacterized protein YciI